MAGPAVADPVRERGLQDYRKKLLEHKEVESRLKESKFTDTIRLCFVLVVHRKLSSHSLHIFWLLILITIFSARATKRTNQTIR